ncbi:CheW protein [Leptolyngbya sp. NIES-3755]|nr:CheW protein [Leptolyngbya sp. NIES-3755]
MTTQPTSPSVRSQHFLRFALSPSTQTMLATDRITEILNLNPQQIIPLPDVFPEVVGVLNWRGEVLWLVDLSYLLGTEPLFHQLESGSYNALVVQHPQGMIGLVINQISQSFWCNPAEIQLLSATQRTTKLSQCLQGYWSTPEGETIWVLDSDAVVNVLHSRSQVTLKRSTN